MKELLHQPEDIITQRYRILDLLGQGGSGTTYLAQDLQSGQPVALKALSLRNIRNWKEIELFEREARVLAQLNHPAIPRYLEYFHVDTDTDRSFYIAQQLAQGQSLFTLVKNGWHTSQEEVRRIATEILEILVYLHQLAPPVIHRDIKPQNIIRQDDGQVFLVDFGAVQDTYHSTFARSSTVVGTFGYMAPEQFLGQAVPVTDLYGLGATLLFLLTHRSPAELPTDRLKLDFRSRVQISDEFANWLEKMLEPDVEERFSSAKEALFVLQGKQIMTRKSRKSSGGKRLVKFGIAAVAAMSILYHFKYPILASIGIVPTQMYVAATWGDVDTVRHYLEQGVGANVTLLHLAGSKEVAQLLIAHGVDVNVKDLNGWTPLHLTESPEVAQLLIAKGADVNAKDNSGRTPLQTTRSPEVAQLLITQGAAVNVTKTLLHYWVWAKSPEVAQLLIAKGAAVNATDKNGKTPLHYWVRSSKVAQILIAKGAAVNATDKEGKTPLHWVRSPKVAQLLIAQGAAVNARDNAGDTPLHVTESPEVAKVLIDNGADINANDKRGRTPKLLAQSPLLAQLLVGKGKDLDLNARDNRGKTLLHLAAENGWKDKVELLIARGADVNATYKDGYKFSTPLSLTRSPEVAQLLITKGADVNAKDEAGMTPLHKARSPEVAKVLIANGADINAKDNEGTTPLQEAVIAAGYTNDKDAVGVVELLIAKDADVNARDKEGKTPLHKTRSLEAAKILIANGGSLQARDNQGNTPLHSAAFSNEVAQLLVANGADVNTKNNKGKTPVEVITQHPCNRSWPPLIFCKPFDD